MADSPPSRPRLLYWGCLLVATIVLILAGNDLVIWLAYRGVNFGSPITIAVVVLILAAFGIWLTVRLVNRGKKPSARLCVCVVLVVGSAALSICIPYYREQQFIQRIEGWGGKVETETAGPDSLRNFVGEDRMKAYRFFERVGVIYLWDTEATDAELAHLIGLTHVRKLCIRNTTVTDGGVTHLSRLTSLRELQLFDAKITDAGLAHLSELKNLRTLFLDGTMVTEKGTIELQKALPDCEIHVIQ